MHDIDARPRRDSDFTPATAPDATTAGGNKTAGFVQLHGWQRFALDVASRRRPHAYGVFAWLLSFGQAKPAAGKLAAYGRIFPSAATLAKQTCLPERTVELTLRELRRCGLCRWTPGHSKRSNEFRITESAEEMLPHAIEAMADELAAAGPKAKLADLSRRCRLWLSLGRLAQSAAPDSAVHCAEGRSPLRDTRAPSTAPQVEGTRSTNEKQKQKPLARPAAAALVAAQEMEAKPDRTEPTEAMADAIEQVKALLAERDIGEPKRTRLAEGLIASGLEPATIASEIGQKRRIAGGLGVAIIEREAGEWLERQRRAAREAAEEAARDGERMRQAGRDAVAKALEKAKVEATMRDQMEPARAAELVRDLSARQSIEMARLEELISKAFAKGAKRQPTAEELAALVEEFEPIARHRKALAKVHKHTDTAGSRRDDPEPTAEELPIVEQIAELLRAQDQAAAGRRPTADLGRVLSTKQAFREGDMAKLSLSQAEREAIGTLPAAHQVGIVRGLESDLPKAREALDELLRQTA